MAEDVSLLVIHNISLPPGQFGTQKIQPFFQNRLDHGEHPYFASIDGLQVSAHFLIERDGSLTQFVSTTHRAWHAGVSSFEGRPDCNDFSLGIELEGDDSNPFTDSQYGVLEELVAAIGERHPLHDEQGALRIRGHSDIAPGRKTDPGPHFDWSRVPAIHSA